MRTVDIRKVISYGFENYQSVGRIARNVHIIYTGLRLGSKGLASVNPTTVYVDVVFSVLEAINEYYQYRKAKEITKQLEIELYVKLEELKYLKAAYEEKLKTQKLQYETCLTQLEEEIQKEKDKMDLLKKLYQESEKHLEWAKNILIEIRRTYVYDDKIREIEKIYVEALRKRIELTYSII